jgi:hypothetical protein
MASMSLNIVILQLAVLIVVLESDLGRRKLSWLRVLRPVITIVIIVPFFFTTLPTSGNDLALQAAGALIGATLGLLSVSSLFVSVGFDPDYTSRWSRRARRNQRQRGASITRAGVGYASIWVAVTVARMGFAYGAQHVFPNALGQFMETWRLSASGLTNAFIFLSIGMDLFRSIGLVGRGRAARQHERRLESPTQKAHTLGPTETIVDAYS